MAKPDIKRFSTPSIEDAEIVVPGNNYVHLSSIEAYKSEWEGLSTTYRANNLEKLRESAFDGNLKGSKFRSVCWSLLLRVINGEPGDWIEHKRQQREKYRKLREEFVRNPHKENDVHDDPLSQSKQSIWNQYFGDQELCSVIKQDVVRTFPGVDFFRKANIQEMMTNILFYYAREHPYMCYRQGMHEILAPILFVMHSDQQGMLHFQEIYAETDEIMAEILDPNYLEADTYFLFSRLMSKIESYYRIFNVVPNADGHFPPRTEFHESSFDNTYTSEIEVIGQLNFIKDKILAKEDLHLHNHLLKLDIPLHIFGIRWLRLLFGREFPLLDLLMVWDAIFADSDRFELPNFIVVAMLVRIRTKLLLSDYTSCLTILMKYPNNVDVNLILKHSLSMLMPSKYERPNGTFEYVNVKTDIKSTEQQPLKCSSLTTLPRNQSKKSTNPELLHRSDSLNRRERSSSLNVDSIPGKIVQIQEKFDLQQPTTTVSRSSHFANLSAPKTSDLRAVEGYSENSTEALRLKLENAQIIMTLSCLKLKKYLTTLRTHLPVNQPEEVNQALDGIEELCALMDIKFLYKSINNVPVDQAFEADEGAQGNRPDVILWNGKPSQYLQNVQHSLPKPNMSEPEINSDAARINNNTKTVQTPCDGPVSPAEVASAISVVAEATNFISATRYEIPDNSFTQNASRILGTKRNVELRLIREGTITGDDTSGIPTPDPLHIQD